MDEPTSRARETVAAVGGGTNNPSRVFSIRRALAARADETLCALLLLAMAFNLLTIISRKSITTDEIVLIPSAYAYVTGGDTQLVHEHPPLVKLLAGLPLLSLPPLKMLPARETAPTRTVAQMQMRVGRFWEDNRAAVERVSFLARLPFIALTVALGVLIFVFARSVFGSRAALLAVALFSLEPTILAHGRVVQTDIAAAFGYLLLCYTLYRYALAPSWKGALWMGAAAALAILAKFSMLLVAPIVCAFFVVFLSRGARREGRGRVLTIAAHAGLVALTSLLLIHAAYLFDRSPVLETDAYWMASAFPADKGDVRLNAAHALSSVLPVDFVLGIFWQIAHNERGHPASLLGMYRNTGWWYYYPVAFALKTTLPFLLVSLASLAWGVWSVAKKRERQFLIFLIPFAVYTGFVLLSRINIGVRYYLPAYPLLFILGGALLARLLNRRPRRSVGFLVAALLLGWAGVEAVRAYPDQMSYMNQLASRHPRWHYLSDSNVEWGDDVRALAEYLRARGETRVRAATLAGDHMLPCYGIENLNLITPVAVEWPPTRYVAIGASFLNGSTVPPGTVRGRTLTEAERINFFDAYRRRTPEAVLGGSIYVFREHD